MARALSMRRRSVTAGDERRYLAERSREAGLFETAGDHLWIFRSEDQPEVFLEFRESGDAARLAAMDPTAELWTEVELA